jgi:hypothetical protein
MLPYSFVYQCAHMASKDNTSPGFVRGSKLVERIGDRIKERDGKDSLARVVNDVTEADAARARDVMRKKEHLDQVSALEHLAYMWNSKATSAR